jgi:multidrug transporter EmrE-like cation transporter
MDGKSGSQVPPDTPMLPYLLLFAALVLSVYSQLIMKSRALLHASASDSAAGYFGYLIGMATDWRVLSAAGATFLASVCWLLVLQRLQLGYALPFMALTFVLVPVSANIFLGEPLPMLQIVGLVLITAGVSISALVR